jgi:hydrogenase maturation protease
MSLDRPPWEELERPGPEVIEVGGVELRRGSKVVLRPGRGADVFDIALAGKTAIVDKIEENMEGEISLAITVEDDPGRDLGEDRRPGHRFFFTPEEVEPLGESSYSARVLVAGIGNIFLADDGFGVAVARRLGERPQPAGVEVKDFGIRGLDLVYALGDGHDAVILIDAVPRGEEPGTLFVIEPEIPDEHVGLDAHGMDPAKVLALARDIGRVPERVLLVGCEPEVRMDGSEDEVVGELSAPVSAAVDRAVAIVEDLVEELTAEDTENTETRRTR